MCFFVEGPKFALLERKCRFWWIFRGQSFFGVLVQIIGEVDFGYFFFCDFLSIFRVFHGKVMWETSFFFDFLTAGLGHIRKRLALGSWKIDFLAFLKLDMVPDL